MRPGSRISLSRMAMLGFSFQPCILLFHHALIQFFEERGRFAQRLARRQCTLRPRAGGPAVIVRQRQVAARLLLVLDHLLRARCSASQLPVVAQVLAPQASSCAVCGTLRAGARMVFRLSTTRTLRVT